ncbi:hypothetical protein BJY04DRAFT_224128 [Aspergillus karnatakaensis]|uniref:uncharacterized protein n=1 Tax=Aspergillus karnatakaensis TaxID=1810916 RepID=UPI003CCD0F28
MRSSQSSGFSLRSLFGLDSKKDKKGKSGKGVAATPFDNNYTSTPRPFRANGPIKKELQVLGIKNDPRKAYPAPTRPQPKYSHPPPPKQPTYAPRKPVPVSKASYRPQTPAYLPRPQASIPVPFRQLPKHRNNSGPKFPLITPGSEKGRRMSSTASVRTFATCSSGVFPNGREPYVVDDYSEEVLMLPTPPKSVKSGKSVKSAKSTKSYGKYTVMPRV